MAFTESNTNKDGLILYYEGDFISVERRTTGVLKLHRCTKWRKFSVKVYLMYISTQGLIIFGLFVPW